jgi:molecular chaperone Hsp33
MIEKELHLEHLHELYGTIPPDEMIIFTLAGGFVRGALIRNTLMVNTLRAYHDLGIIETLALGHAYTSAGLLSSDMKGDERLVLRIDCSGPLKGIVCEARAQGYIRGYLKVKEIEIEQPVRDLDLAPFFGIGLLSVSKHITGESAPFTGQVDLKYGRPAEDLAYYYLMSEQVPSAVSLSIAFDPEGRVNGAGGLLLQAMPEAEKDTLDTLTDRVTALPSIGKLFSAKVSPESLLDTHFGDFIPDILARKPLRFFCSCNKERFRAFLSALPLDDRMEMALNGPFPIVLSCFNCNSAYTFSEEEMREITAIR